MAPIKSTQYIDMAVEQVNDVMINAYHENCKETTNVQRGSIAWWKEEVHKAKRTLWKKVCEKVHDTPVVVPTIVLARDHSVK